MTQWLSGMVVLFIGFLPGTLSAPLYAVNPTLRPPEVKKDVTVVFGGDLMFDRSIREKLARNGEDYALSCVDEILLPADLVVANLEGPITSNPSMSLGSAVGSPENFTFTFPTTTATMLARHNIRLVNIGNNHIMNFGASGLLETKRWLSAAGVRYFGEPDVAEEERLERLDVKGIPFSFLNWNEWGPGTLSEMNAQIAREVAFGRRAIVYTHWGDEYVNPTEKMRKLAHAFIDAGAMMVIGSHPHVVQESELYNGKRIYYSLGNFVFDQYWNEDVSTGLLLRVVFTKDGVKGIEELPISIHRDGRTCLRSQED
jgi:poly-gamma-glutamate synthesis protein (capsule biosynthesis protein)